MRVSWLASLVFVAFLGLSGTVGATTLSVAQMPSHTHIGSESQYAGQGNPPTYPTGRRRSGNNDPDGYCGTTHAAGSSGAHTHALSGSSGAANSLPPYYALAYIMRIA